MSAHVAAGHQGGTSDRVDILGGTGDEVTVAPIAVEADGQGRWKLVARVTIRARAPLPPHLEYAEAVCGCVLEAPGGALGTGRCGTLGAVPSPLSPAGMPLSPECACELTTMLERGQDVRFAVTLTLFPTAAEVAPDIPDGAPIAAHDERLPREATLLRREPTLLGNSAQASTLLAALEGALALSTQEVRGVRLRCVLAALKRSKEERGTRLHLVVPARHSRPHAARTPPHSSGPFLLCHDGHRLWSYRHGRADLQRGMECSDLRALCSLGSGRFLLCRARGESQIFDAARNRVAAAAPAPLQHEAVSVAACHGGTSAAMAAVTTAGDVFFMLPDDKKACAWEYALTLGALLQPLRRGALLLAQGADCKDLVLLQGVTAPPGEDPEAESYMAAVERACLLSEAHRWRALSSAELMRACGALGQGGPASAPRAGVAAVSVSFTPEGALRLRHHAILGRATQVQWLGEPACAPVEAGAGPLQAVFYLDRGGWMHKVVSVGYEESHRTHATWRCCNPSRADALLRVCSLDHLASPSVLLFSAHANDLGSSWRPQSIADTPLRVRGDVVVFRGLSPFCAGHALDGSVLWARSLPHMACDAIQCRARLLVSTHEAVLVLDPESGAFLSALPLSATYLAAVRGPHGSHVLALTHADGAVTLRSLSVEARGESGAAETKGNRSECAGARENE